MCWLRSASKKKLNLNRHMRYQAGYELLSVCSTLHLPLWVCVCVCYKIQPPPPTESSQHTSRQSEHAAFGQSLCVLQVEAGHAGGEGVGGGGVGAGGWSRSQTPRSLTPPGCWPRAGVEAGATEGPRGQGSPGSGQVRGGRRSSGAEWCWGTVRGTGQVTLWLSHGSHIHSVHSLLKGPSTSFPHSGVFTGLVENS